MPKKRKHAFTMLEVLMAITLMGTMTAFILGPGRAMFRGEAYEPLEETLRRSIREARMQAVARAEAVTLEWDAEDYSLVIRETGGREIMRIESEAGTANDDILFERIRPWERPEVPGDNVDTAIVDRLRFDPDRGSTPFVALVHYAGVDTRLRYDPLSNLRLEEDAQ